MPAGARLLSLCVALAGVLAACGTAGSSRSSTPTSIPSVTGTIPDTPVSTAPSSGPKTGQTDTAWGRIWDGLPPSFPVVPGATPDESATGDPASAVLVIDGGDAAGVTHLLQTELKTAGYTAVGSAEPLEDGSIVLEMTGHEAACRIQVTATPTGGLTTVRILYGAACPFE